MTSSAQPSPSGRATLVSGVVEPRFAAVAAAFAENFDVRGDTGAACSVYFEGRQVVDLWAGDTGSGPWARDTRSIVFSVSKGITTICLLMAAERGLLELDAPVAQYWPEFGAFGKEAVTVRQVLAHRAGLPWPEVDLTPSDLLAWDPVVKALAEQAPVWEPGSDHAYHALTVGWLAGEVLRRVTGMRPAEWLDRHVCAPLQVEMAFGVDPAAPDLALMQPPLPVTDEAAAAELAAAMQNPGVVRAMSLGAVFDVTDLCGSFNRPEIMRAEIPAGGLVTNARNLARVYASAIGEVEGVRLLSDAVLDDAVRVQSEGTPFAGPDAGHRWGTGFMLSSRARPMLGPGSFGHDGAGGQLAFGHRGLRIGFGYHTNRPGGIPDDRADALCRALESCLTPDARGMSRR